MLEQALLLDEGTSHAVDKVKLDVFRARLQVHPVRPDQPPGRLPHVNAEDAGCNFVLKLGYPLIGEKPLVADFVGMGGCGDEPPFGIPPQIAEARCDQVPCLRLGKSRFPDHDKHLHQARCVFERQEPGLQEG